MMKKQKEKTEFRKAKLKQTIIEWTLGTIIFIIAMTIMGFVFWFVGKQQGKWQMRLEQISNMKFRVVSDSNIVLLICSSRKVAEWFIKDKLGEQNDGSNQS